MLGDLLVISLAMENLDYRAKMKYQTGRFLERERGSGETLACGTGACAVAVASILNGLTDDIVAMIMAAAGTLWATADGWKRNLWYGLCTCIGFVALILGESDNAYLSLAAFFGFLPLYFSLF